MTSRADKRPPHILETWQEVSGASPRAGVIVAVAFIEDQLAIAILERMRVLSAVEEKKLLEGPAAPLGTLSGKIQVGYALALFGEAVRDDLLIVKDIRNQFAHQIETRDFRDGNIVKLCSRLNYTAHQAKASMQDAKRDAYEQFHDAANHLLTGLTLMVHNMNGYGNVSRMGQSVGYMDYPIIHVPRAPSHKKARVKRTRPNAGSGHR